MQGENAVDVEGFVSCIERIMKFLSIIYFKQHNGLRNVLNGKKQTESLEVNFKHRSIECYTDKERIFKLT